MNENKIIILPYGRALHILEANGDTLCEITPPKSGVRVYTYYPRRLGLNFCEKCLTRVGREMVADYLGHQFFDAEPSQDKHKKRLV